MYTSVNGYVFNIVSLYNYIRRYLSFYDRNFDFVIEVMLVDIY